jgi:hypothetical protein
MKKITLGILILTLSLGLTLYSFSFHQDEKTPELKREIVKMNYIEVKNAYGIVLPYKSRYGKIQPLRERNMLIIEDQPEFVQKILSILEEIDVKPIDIQCTVDLILASKSKDTSFEPDKNLQSDPLMRELMSVMNYRSFKHIDTSLIRVQDNSNSYQRIGGSGLGFQLYLEPRHYREENKDQFQIELRFLQVESTHEIGNSERSYPLKNPVPLIDTSLSIQSGDRSVVGVSKLNGGDLALILIVKGKVIK